MKDKIKASLIILSIILVLLIGKMFSKTKNKYTPNDLVSYNGWLNVKETNIKNKYGEIIQLVGVSTHGIQWYSDYITPENVKRLKEEWGVNVIRIAVYTEVDDRLVYTTETDNILKKTIETVINEDMYVIIDWHVLVEKDPNRYKKEALDFFDNYSKEYANIPNVIYEICNEPNGDEITWNNQVKPYAQEIIERIRNNSKKSLIIVGTPNWCRDFSEVKDNLLDYNNILYSYHFYAGEEDIDISELNEIIDYKIPIIVTEWGITDSTGNGEIYIQNANNWVDVLNENNLSWIMWSFSNKEESTAILQWIYETDKDIDSNLTETGKYVREIIKKTKGKKLKEDEEI